MVSPGNTVLYSESFTYDANANQITRTDGLGNVTNYTYDSVGNLLKQTDPAGVRPPTPTIRTATFSQKPMGWGTQRLTNTTKPTI